MGSFLKRSMIWWGTQFDWTYEIVKLVVIIYNKNINIFINMYIRNLLLFVNYEIPLNIRALNLSTVIMIKMRFV